jgi:hypothetical protein
MPLTLTDDDVNSLRGLLVAIEIKDLERADVKGPDAMRQLDRVLSDRTVLFWQLAFRVQTLLGGKS